MNVISFSLFGKHPKYSEGAVRNAELASKMMPGWQCVFYVSEDAPAGVGERLKQAGAIVRSGDHAIRNEMFWRFLIADDPSVQRFLIRDTDSRLNPRDAAAVIAWVQSGIPFHSIRDHPYHTWPLGGGLWGGMRGFLPNIRPLIRASGLARKPYDRENQYGKDQIFLADFIWPLVRQRVIQHDSCNRHNFPGSIPFPDGLTLDDWRFVGEIIDEFEVPEEHGWTFRKEYLTKNEHP